MIPSVSSPAAWPQYKTFAFSSCWWISLSQTKGKEIPVSFPASLVTVDATRGFLPWGMTRAFFPSFAMEILIFSPRWYGSHCSSTWACERGFGCKILQWLHCSKLPWLLNPSLAQERLQQHPAEESLNKTIFAWLWNKQSEFQKCPLALFVFVLQLI